MTFVLIVIMGHWLQPGSSSYSNANAGMTSFTQEFNTAAACEQAKVIFDRDVDRELRYLRTMCVPKG